MPALVHVVLSSVSGDRLELDVDPQCTVRSLKGKVGEVWQVPPLCQKLAVGQAALRDEDILSDQCRSGSPKVSMTMVITYEDVYKGLTDKNTDMRCAAVASLPYMARVDQEQAIAALRDSMEDQEWEVRREAVEIVPELLPPGDKGAVAATMARVTDSSCSVRQAAVRAVGRLLPEGCGDETTISMAIALLEDDNDDVRRAATATLAHVVDPSDAESREGVVATLAQSVQHWSPLVKRAAMESLSLVAEKGDDRVVEIMKRHLKDDMGLLRQAAVLALGKVASTGDPRIISLVKQSSKDKDARVRMAAAAALAELNGDECAPGETAKPGSPSAGGA